jgi:L-seryl-tRNA(Ser) seleniumtransferase/D-glucosaminate-6-phosphate ammonia-lyase
MAGTAIDRIARDLGAPAALAAAGLPAALALALLSLRRGTAGRRPHGPRTVAVQTGQLGRLGGATLPQLFRLAGIRPALAGSVERCTTAEFAAALEGAVGGLAVANPAPAAGLLGPAEVCWACRERALPSLVLDLGAGTPEVWLDAGADLVLFDARALGGPSLGILCGESGLVGSARDLLEGEGAAFAAPPELLAGLEVSRA